MLKVLIIVGLFFMAIYYVLVLPFRPRTNLNNQQSQKKRAPNSNVDIDYVPEDEKHMKKKGHDIGGDYVDYEEVK